MKDNFSVIWHCLVQRAQDVSIVKKTLKSHAHLHLSAVWRRDAGREIHSFIKTRCSMYKFWLTLHHPSRLMHSRKRMSWMQSHYYGRRGGPHYSNWEKSGTTTTTGHHEDDAMPKWIVLWQKAFFIPMLLARNCVPQLWQINDVWVEITCLWFFNLEQRKCKDFEREFWTFETMINVPSTTRGQNVFIGCPLAPQVI